METIHNYRQVVDKKIIRLFEKAIKEVIKSSTFKNIGFIGLVVNYKKKIHHDIDLLIFPSITGKIGEALIELEELYDEIERRLRKINERYYLATCSKKSMQELVYYLASIEEGSPGLIPIHSLFFPDHKSFKKYNPVSFEKEIEKNLITLYGDFKIIHNIKDNISEKLLEPYFVIIDFELNARIKTFPKHNIRASAESLFDYLKDKYNIGIKNKVPHDPNDIKKEFKKLMRTLDKMVYIDKSIK